MPTPKIIAKFETSLSAGIDYSASLMTLSSIVTKNTTNMPAGTYGFVIDEGTGDEEYVLGICDGSTAVITGLTRGVSYLDGLTSVPTLAKSHRKGAQVKISDHPALIAMYDRSVVWRGVYNAGTTYENREAVSYNGSSFIAKQQTTGNIPTNTTYWDVLAAQGIDSAGAIEPGVNGSVMTSNGITWVSNPPADGTLVMAYRSTNQATSGATLAIFDTELYDTLNEYNNTTGIFTASTTGYYDIRCQVIAANFSRNSSGDDDGQIIFYKDNTIYHRCAFANYTVYEGGMVGRTIMYLTAGQTAKVYVQAGAGAGAIYAGSAKNSNVQITRLVLSGVSGPVGATGPAGADSTVPGPQGPVGPQGPAGTGATVVTTLGIPGLDTNVPSEKLLRDTLEGSTITLSNKRISKRVVTTTQSATPTINTNNGDIFQITGLTQAITSFTTNLTGTPVAGDMIMIQITDNGTARALSFGASFEGTTSTPLPTTTVISTLLRILFQRNTANDKWTCIGIN